MVFSDLSLVSENLEGAIERIDIREDCADFTAAGLIRFYLENEHRLADVNTLPIFPKLGYKLVPRGKNRSYGVAALIFAAIEYRKTLKSGF